MASDADTDKLLLNNFTNATSTSGAGGDALPMDSWKVVVSSVLLLICISGIVGNCCVIVVIVRYAKTKTVTNLYIANLAVADLCFLVGLPFLVVTSILERWVFGDVVCRLFFVSRDPDHTPLSKFFSGVMSGLSLGACLPNLESVALVVTELY